MVNSVCFKRDGFGRHHQVRPQDFAPFIPKRKLRESLGDLDITVNSEEEVETLFFVMDIDDNKGIDEMEFKKALQASSHSIVYMERSWFFTSGRVCSDANISGASNSDFLSTTLIRCEFAASICSGRMGAVSSPCLAPYGCAPPPRFTRAA